MKNLTGCFSHDSDNWKTPSRIYEAFMKANFVDCFPYKSEEDEFAKVYKNKKLFVNPPFSKMNKVTDWIIKNSTSNLIALLIPARTDTKYFHKLLDLNPLILFIEKRLKYNDFGSAPFPTILMIINYTKIPIYLKKTQEELINTIKRI